MDAPAQPRHRAHTGPCHLAPGAHVCANVLHGVLCGAGVQAAKGPEAAGDAPLGVLARARQALRRQLLGMVGEWVGRDPGGRACGEGGGEEAFWCSQGKFVVGPLYMLRARPRWLWGEVLMWLAAPPCALCPILGRSLKGAGEREWEWERHPHSWDQSGVRVGGGGMCLSLWHGAGPYRARAWPGLKPYPPAHTCGGTRLMMVV